MGKKETDHPYPTPLTHQDVVLQQRQKRLGSLGKTLSMIKIHHETFGENKQLGTLDKTMSEIKIQQETYDSKALSDTVRSEPPRNFEMTDTTHLSEAQVTEFKEAFSMFDRNGDGSISRAELGTAMKSLGQNPTDNELTDMIKEADDNENGSVDFNEFLLLMSKKMSMLDIDQELLEAFSVFDKDGNGFIDSEELTSVLSSLDEELDEEQVKVMMKQADKNGDGLVSFDEFKDVMCSKSNA